MRLPALVFPLLAIAIAGNADAQPKKKKPKKPKTEQPHETNDEPSEPAPSNNADPPKIDTNLREEDAPPATNPWVASGEAKKRGVEDDRASSDRRSSSSDHDSDRRRKSEDEWQSRPIAIAALAGYASADLRIGLGVRVGYSISDRIYVGGAFTYHLGTTFGDVTLSGYYPAAELGYDYHVQGFTIRPYGGVGMLFLHLSGNLAKTNGVDVTDGNALVVYPGLQFDYQIGAGFVGADARILFIFESGRDTSLGFFAVGGARF